MLFYQISSNNADINCSIPSTRKKKVRWRDDDGVSNIESIKYIPARKNKYDINEKTVISSANNALSN